MSKKTEKLTKEVDTVTKKINETIKQELSGINLSSTEFNILRNRLDNKSDPSTNNQMDIFVRRQLSLIREQLAKRDVTIEAIQNKTESLISQKKAAEKILSIIPEENNSYDKKDEAEKRHDKLEKEIKDLQKEKDRLQEKKEKKGKSIFGKFKNTLFKRTKRIDKLTKQLKSKIIILDKYAETKEETTQAWQEDKLTYKTKLNEYESTHGKILKYSKLPTPLKKPPPPSHPPPQSDVHTSIGSLLPSGKKFNDPLLTCKKLPPPMSPDKEEVQPPPPSSPIGRGLPKPPQQSSSTEKKPISRGLPPPPRMTPESVKAMSDEESRGRG